jgi:hypothetical protein
MSMAYAATTSVSVSKTKGEISEREKLIARLEALSGPDREVDALLWAFFDGRTVRYDDGKMLAGNSRPPHDECLLGFIDPGKKARNFTPVFPAFRVTASLDEAVALAGRLLPRKAWTLGQNVHHRYWLASFNELNAEGEPTSLAWGQSSTPVPALLAALLRSLPENNNVG